MIQVKSNAVQAAFERADKPINMAVPHINKAACTLVDMASGNRAGCFLPAAAAKSAI